MSDLSQSNFNRAEQILDAMSRQDGLVLALLRHLDGKLAAEDERVVHALIDAQEDCRVRAARAADRIARSGHTRAAERAC